jgi:ATP-dependent Clp protease ATP-binding subunit ClpB
MLGVAHVKGESAHDTLVAVGATHEAILKALTAVRGSQRVTDQNPEGKFQALEKYAKDLTELGAARQAGPGDWARRGDSPRDPGAEPAHEK